MDRGQRLEDLLDLSLAKAKELLQMGLTAAGDDYLKLAAMQKDLIVSLINTGVKVDENRFRKKSNEALGEILKQVLARAQEPGSTLLESHPSEDDQYQSPTPAPTLRH